MCKIPIILWIANAAAPARSAAVKVAKSRTRSILGPCCSRTSFCLEPNDPCQTSHRVQGTRLGVLPQTLCEPLIFAPVTGKSLSFIFLLLWSDATAEVETGRVRKWKAGRVRYWQYGQAKNSPILAISDLSRFLHPSTRCRPVHHGRESRCFNPCCDGTDSSTQHRIRLPCPSRSVSILVVMERTHRRCSRPRRRERSSSFNPCCDGTDSSTRACDGETIFVIVFQSLL